MPTIEDLAKDIAQDKGVLDELRVKRRPPIFQRLVDEWKQAQAMPAEIPFKPPFRPPPLPPGEEPPFIPLERQRRFPVSERVTAPFAPEMARQEPSFGQNPTYWMWKSKLLPDLVFSSEQAQREIGLGKHGLAANDSLARIEFLAEGQKRREEAIQKGEATYINPFGGFESPVEVEPHQKLLSFPSLTGGEPERILRTIPQAEPPTKRAEDLTEARFGERLATSPNPLIRLANTPTVVFGLTPADFAMIGSLGYGGYSGVRSLIPLTQKVADKAFGKVLNTGLDKWIVKRSQGVPPQHFKKAQDFLYGVLAKEKIPLQERATQNWLRRLEEAKAARLGNTVARQRAVQDTIRDIEDIFIPRATQTGIVRGGLPAGQAFDKALWARTPVSERVSIAQARGLEGKVGSKAWENLTGTERQVLAKPPIIPGAEVPFMITKDMESRLKAMELTDAEINKLTPQEAWNRLNIPTEIPKAEPGMPEAGLQPEMFGAPSREVRPAGKGKITQISMEEQLKLEQARQAVEVPYTATEVENMRAELEGLKATLAEDPVALARFKIGGKKVDLTHFISLRERTYPDYFTIKEAQALFPGHDFTALTKKGRVPRDAALDDLTKRFNMTPDEIADRVTQITKEKAGIKELETTLKGITPEMIAPEAAAIPEVAKVSPEVISEEVAVTEVAGKPPKPPKDWDKIGGKLYDDFKRQVSSATPNTVPPSNRLARAWMRGEQIVTDEFARLNWLGWQAEVDTAMVRASGGRAGQLYRDTMRNIVRSLNNDSNLISYVDDYLMLRHQLEVLKATGRKYFVVVRGEKTRRFTAQQIGLLFAQMKKELGVTDYARVKEAASHIPAVYNQLLKGTEELTQEQIGALIRKYPWYNPIVFVKESAPVNIARKLSSRQIRQLTTLEADREQLTPLMSLGSTISRRVRAQAINDARKSISEAAITTRNKPLVGGDVEIVIKKPEGAFVDFFDNGQRKYLKLGKGAEWIAKDIELFQRQNAGMLIRGVQSLQNLSKMAFTTYNPAFMAWNTTFDMVTSFFTEGITPLRFGKALAGNIKAIFKDVPAVSEFRRAGGEMLGFFERGTIELTGGEKVISSFIGKQQGRIVLKNPESLKRFINPLELIRELGIAGENAARRATFEKALESGLSVKEAILRGRRVTVDFSRFSEASRHINNWYIYFNPALQGFLLPGRAIAKNPNSLWRLGVLIAGYIGLTVYNQSYDEYKDVRDSDKVGKLVVMLPSNEYSKYGQKVPHYLTLLPLREFAMFTAPIEYLLGKLQAEDSEAYRTFAQEWGVLYPVISPLSMISETGGLVIPTQVGATFQQIIQNHDDFRDRAIVDDEMALLPSSQQYDQYTDKLAIRIGQALNMSPKKLDFFAQSMFGQLGDDFLRTIDLAISNLDKEQIDVRIVALIAELRNIPSTVPPSQIEVARETFLEKLSVEDRELVLNMERLPDDQIPFITSMANRFYRTYGGQVYATAKERAFETRKLEDYPPEALEQLQKDANENAFNLINDKISKYQYDQNRTRYRAYYSGAATAQWRQAMKEGAVSRADIDKFMPESYKRSEEFQAVSAYMEIREKNINEAGGVFDSATWDKIESLTLAELRLYYSRTAIQYAILHKDDWIDNLPEPARTVERQRAKAIEDETWWDDYRGAVKSPTRPSTSRPKITLEQIKKAWIGAGRP